MSTYDDDDNDDDDDDGETDQDDDVERAEVDDHAKGYFKVQPFVTFFRRIIELFTTKKKSRSKYLMI